MSKIEDAAAARARAEARFKPATLDAAQDARSVAEAERDATVAKTARLREMRLAKERTDAIAAQVRRERRDRRQP